MKIATLNMNGETWFSINRRPRLPQNIFDIEKIKRELTNLTKERLAKILSEKEFDIIAVQEFVNSQNERNEIETIINKNGYKFLKPEAGKGTHFIAGFIVKECYEQYCRLEKQITELPANRSALLKFAIDENTSFSILNIHVKNHNIQIPEIEGNIILLGDMNACKADQTSNNVAINKEFLERIEIQYIPKVPEKAYTWRSNGVDKQLDHIYISKKFNYELFSISEVAKKEDSTNFYYEKGSGFTDHSMLIMEIEV